MSTTDRRTILRAASAAAVAAAFPETISRALAIEANSVTGTLQDVEHIVVLMQENRSFDHYFGTLRGVRGFSDPRAVTLPSGNSVFLQPPASGATAASSAILPFRPNLTNLGLQFLGDLAHSWSDAHGAWNNGNYDKWVKNKGTATMAYMTRADIPFHYALADAFTICDAYHCSLMTSTDPNRYYLWSGWVGQNGTTPAGINVANSGSTPGTPVLNNSGGSVGNGTPPLGPVVNNDEQGYNWTTYPERLLAAGITWKIYQDKGGPTLSAANSWGWTSNAPYVGNYGDTSVLYFQQYQTATVGSPLYNAALTGTNVSNGGLYNGGTFFDLLRADVMNNTLPQVSWIVAPEAYSEHPNWPANYGAWYVSNVLAALTANPSVWSKTVFIINFDENDGFFDHIVPPTAPAALANGKSTIGNVNEIYPGTTSSSYQAGPYGLGARVPLLVISPWSKGGWVCSQTFDHTSIIRFIEQRFGVVEPNITPWRRTVCGDLTSALNFSIANATSSRLPATTAYVPPSGDITTGKRHSSVTATPPTQQSLPAQEPGARLARALPYQLQADATADLANDLLAITFANAGSAGAFFHVRAAPTVPALNNGGATGGGAGPWGYTVEAGKSIADSWAPTTAAIYDFSVYGPNGLFRRFAGSYGASAANLTVQCAYDTLGGNVTVTVTNIGAASTTVTITDQYTGNTAQQTLANGGSFQTPVSLAATYAWYDLLITASGDASFVRQYAGHVETGADSVTDPYL